MERLEIISIFIEISDSVKTVIMKFSMKNSFNIKYQVIGLRYQKNHLCQPECFNTTKIHLKELAELFTWKAIKIKYKCLYNNEQEILQKYK